MCRTSKLDRSELWRIHGCWYDLRAFSARHPGGSVAIALAQGTDATELFEQFHLLNESHRALLKRCEVVERDESPAAQGASAFHEDLKAMVRDHFKGQNRGAHKAKATHLALMVTLLVLYACAFVRWAQGSIAWGALGLPVLAWFLMANMSHDGSHHAASMRPWLNEAWLVAASPLLFSYASWYMQHCVSHHRHTNSVEDDVDVSHHPFARWHRRTKLDSKYMSAVINLAWHGTAWALSTVNMSVVHPWKFVVVPLCLSAVREKKGDPLPPIFGRGNAAYAAEELRAGRDAPHELAFFRVAGDLHRNGMLFQSRTRVAAAVGTWLAAVLFLTTPFLRFDTGRALALTVVPYLLTSFIFFAVTQVSHVQEACQPTTALPMDFFKRQTATALDYAAESHLWRFLTGGLNLQSIHHIMPGVHSSHYTDLYPKFLAICHKHHCAPTILPNFTDALKAHLRHVAHLGDLGKAN